MSQQILVIGVTGLLGKPVAYYLQKAEFQVRVMSRNAARAREEFPKPFEVVAADALRPADVEEALAG